MKKQLQITLTLVILLLSSIGMAQVGAIIPPSTSYIVTNLDDSGEGSLRWAMESANASPDLSVITFDLPGIGPHEIEVESSPLPILNYPTFIDGGNDEQCAHGEALVVVDFHEYADGIVFRGNNSRVRGIGLKNFSDHGVVLQSSTNLVEGCYFYREGQGTLGTAISIHPNGTAEAELRNNAIYNNYIGKTIEGEAMEGRFSKGVSIGVSSTTDANGSALYNKVGSLGSPNYFERCQNAVYLSENYGPAAGAPADFRVLYNTVSGNTYRQESGDRKIEIVTTHVLAGGLGPNNYPPREEPQDVLASPSAVSGTAEPGDALEVYKGVPNTLTGVTTYVYLGKAIADASGSWTLPSSIWEAEGKHLNDGDLVAATGTDGHSNTTEFSTYTTACTTPLATFYWDGCDGLSMRMLYGHPPGTITSAPVADNSHYTFSWNFGDPASGLANTSTERNPYHDFTTMGEAYNVQLTVHNAGCSSSVTKVVTPQTEALLNFGLGESGTCVGSSIDFTSLSLIPANWLGVSYHWDFGDGSTGTGNATTHSYSEAGNYEITLTVTSTTPACEKSISKTIQVGSGISASIEAEDESCAGAADGKLKVVELSGEGPFSFAWSSPITSTSSGVSNLAPGTYSVTVTDQLGCELSLSGTVEAGEGVGSVSVNVEDPFLCKGESTTLTASGYGSGSVVWNNGMVGSSISVTEGGRYIAKAVFSDGCESEPGEGMVYLIDLEAKIRPAGPVGICPGKTVQLLAEETGVDYSWSTGAETRSTLVSSSGSYSLTVSKSGCEATAEVEVYDRDDCNDFKELCNIGAFPTIEDTIDPCQQYIHNVILYNAQLKYERHIADQKAKYRKNYIKHCLANAEEQLQSTYKDGEYHYTLYYYDKAGNLVRTIPPEGVKRLEGASTIAAVQTAREAGTAQPIEHDYPTTYKYNSLKQLVAVSTPDEDGLHLPLPTGTGTSSSPDDLRAFSRRMYYDFSGRLIVTQNSKQSYKGANPAGDKDYSYLVYDEEGRVIEAGEITQDEDVETIFNIAGQQIGDYETWLSAGTKREVVRTYYHAPLEENVFFPQRNLRNRIAAVSYDVDGNGTYEYASHYSYDIHGNVEDLMQENKTLAHLGAGAQYCRMHYVYDLISGNVNELQYQKGMRDQFFVRYHYDADNRITHVETSTDGYTWKEDAKYEYYKHGPLARMELGDQKVQGMDYAYTLQGWLKGVNSNTLLASRDMGNDQDGTLADNLNAYIPQDEIGVSLGYYNDDYKAIGSGNGSYVNPIADESGATGEDAIASAERSLYNGNISQMVTSIRKLGVEGGTSINGMSYTYDQLNRITSAKSHDVTSVVANNSWGMGAPAAAGYTTGYTYDRNGNLETLTRTDAAGEAMDELSYTYDNAGSNKRNRLMSVADAIDTDGKGYGDFQQGSTDYTYDRNGSLISDSQEEIETITWNVAQKVTSVTRIPISTKDDLEFQYGPMGHRTMKLSKPKNTDGSLKDQRHWKYTYYVRDASGQLMATYNRSFEEVSDHPTGNNYQEVVRLQENPLYGSSRLGIKNREHEAVQVGGNTFTLAAITIEGKLGKQNVIPEIATSLTGYGNFEASTGHNQYELSNHLGNVLATVSDRIDVTTNTEGDLVYAASVGSANDYYPFGMNLPGRTFTSSDYRYGFNGMEKDDEMKGKGNSYDFGARIYDARIGKFLSIDPDFNKYPFMAPYVFAGNDPVRFEDLYGLGPKDRVAKAKSFVGTKYSRAAGVNTGKKLRSSMSEKALEYLDCSELVCRVLAHDNTTSRIRLWNTALLLKNLSDEKKFMRSDKPKVGDVFLRRTDDGGHTGIVTGVNDDGTIEITHAKGKKYGTVTETIKISKLEKSAGWRGFYRPVSEQDSEVETGSESMPDPGAHSSPVINELRKEIGIIRSRIEVIDQSAEMRAERQERKGDKERAARIRALGNSRIQRLERKVRSLETRIEREEQRSDGSN